MRLKTFGGLWIDGADAATAPNARPRGLALLAILAAAGQKAGVSRDRILGVLWPESDAERARHALSQTLYNLRKDLGVELVQSTPDLRLDARTVSSDVAEFRAAFRSSAWLAAAELYVGPFLEGFYLADAPEFERWTEIERASLGADAARAIELAARDEATAGRREQAAELFCRLTRLDPVNPRLAIAYMEALANLGDRTGALVHGKAYSELVRREFDAPPDQDVKRLIRSLRELERSDAYPIVSRGTTRETPARLPAPPPTVRRRVTARTVAGAASVLFVLSVSFAWRSIARDRVAVPMITIGRIRDLSPHDSTGIGGVLSEMFATSLGRGTVLQVVEGAHTGATDRIEGELIPMTGRLLRLNVRRVDVERGVVRAAYEITGDDRIAMVDSAAALITAGMRLANAARASPARTRR